MRSEEALEGLARTHLWDVPLARAVPLLHGIEKSTTESLSDQRLVEIAKSGVRAEPSRFSGTGRGRARGFR